MAVQFPSADGLRPNLPASFSSLPYSSPSIQWREYGVTTEAFDTREVVSGSYDNQRDN
jgi:hypothetical protein